MKDLIIRYRSGDDTVSVRRISEMELEAPDRISAFCHLRNERRTFVFKRILEACDAESGEVVDDVAAVFGGHTPAAAAVVSPTSPSASLAALRRGTEEYQRERNRQKRALMKPFRLAVIYALYRDRLLGLFNHRCYKCRQPGPLDLDHHVPMVLGGQLVAGNIVALCKRCNNVKHDRAPEEFYTADELATLESILVAEEKVLAFRFDWNHWNADRRAYLIAIGIDPTLVDEVLTDPNHPLYIEPLSEIGVRIAIACPNSGSSEG